MIQAVVFDYGQVISLPPDPQVLTALAGLAGVEPGALLPALLDLREDYDRGLVDGAGYYGRVLERLGRAAGDGVPARMAAVDCDGWARVNPASEALIRDLLRVPVTVGILSNMPWDFLRRERARLAVFGLAQVSVFSCEEGAVKPEPAIYRTLLDRLGCPAGAVAFFDDVPRNVDGARALGIRAFVWEGVAAARERLAGLGVAVEEAAAQ